MSARTIQLTDKLYQYLLDNSLREPEVLKRLRADTSALPFAMMQISPEQGQFMRLLVELMGARRALEVGTFTGYSAISIALGLPPDGRLITCDVDDDTTEIAHRYWTEAGLAERIELRLGVALETLDGLLADGAAGSFDFMFIDADKSNYDGYYERGLTLLRPGGLVAIDNALWDGSVIDRHKQDHSTRAIRALNRKVHEDVRVGISLVPIGDGVMLARKL